MAPSAIQSTQQLIRRHGLLPRITIDQINAYFQSGHLSAVQLWNYCRTLRNTTEPTLHAYHYIPHDDDDVSRIQAERADVRLKRGVTNSKLTGIPVSIKANLAVADWPLTAGSRILQDPPGYNASIVQALMDQDVILMGHTAMDEFGMGSLGTHVKDNVPRNPIPHLVTTANCHDYDPDTILRILQLPTEALQEIVAEQCAQQEQQQHHYAPGGSSAGSAISVASGSAIISIGSDTGGSVRLPAAWCGVVGYKPSYGSISRHGLVSYASSFDTVGILGPSVECVRSVYECWLEYKCSSEQETRDSTERSVDSAKEVLESILTKADPTGIKGLRVGIPAAFSTEDCSDEVVRAWNAGAKRLEKQGATVAVVPDTLLDQELLQQALAAYYILVSAEAASNLSRYDGLRYGSSSTTTTPQSSSSSSLSPLEHQYAHYRTNGFGREVIRRILCGTAVTSSDAQHTNYEAATQIRAALTSQFRTALRGEFDVLLVPTAMVAEPPTIDNSSTIDSTAMLANDILTVPMSLAGLATLSVPMESWSSDTFFPPGLQLVAASEAVVLRAAAALMRDEENCSD